MLKFIFNNPTGILFGNGKLNELGNQKFPGKMAIVMGIENADKLEDFITALVSLQKKFGVNNLSKSRTDCNCLCCRKGDSSDYRRNQSKAGGRSNVSGTNPAF